MNIVKRALLYLSRKKARSLILFVMMLVMGLFLMVGISIRFSARKAAEDVRKSITTGITIRPNPIDGNLIFDSSINEEGQVVSTPKVPLLTESKIPQLLRLKGVSGYYTTLGFETLYAGLELKPGYWAASAEEFRSLGDEENAKCSETYAHANTFYEVIEGKRHPSFMNGSLELVEGRHIQSGDKGKAVISEELARRNHLQIGDVIESYNFDFLTGEIYGSAFRSEIVGVFRINFEQPVSESTDESTIISNMLFVDYEMRQWAQVWNNTHYGRKVSAKQKDRHVGNITLYVEDPLMLDLVREQIERLDTVDWSYYRFERYDHEYQLVAKPLNTMILLSTVLAVFMAVGALVLLSLVFSMWIRGRKREAGILSYVGIKKRKIIFQLLLESVLVAVAAVVLAGFLAKPVTEAVGRGMSDYVNKSLGARPYEVDYNAETRIVTINKTPTEPVALEYHLTWPIMLFVFMAMLLVVMAAVLASSRSILRQKPMDVLRGG